MEKKASKNEIVPLPTYFKIIGLVVMAIAIVPAIIVKVINIEILQSQKEILKVFSINTFILGLLFIAWSKDKVEDEMIVAIRLKAMAGTFITAVIYVIISPIVDLVFKEPIGSLTGQQVVITMLFSYLMMYYAQKYLS